MRTISTIRGVALMRAPFNLKKKENKMRLIDNVKEILKDIERVELGTNATDKDFQRLADLMSELNEAQKAISQGLNAIDRDLHDEKLSFNYFTNELMKINITMEKITKGGENE